MLQDLDTQKEKVRNCAQKVLLGPMSSTRGGAELSLALPVPMGVQQRCEVLQARAETTATVILNWVCLNFWVVYSETMIILYPV